MQLLVDVWLLIHLIFCGRPSSFSCQQLYSMELCRATTMWWTSGTPYCRFHGMHWIVKGYNFTCVYFQLLYLGIINGAYVTWLFVGQPLLPTYFIGSHHSYFVLAGIIICEGSFFWACYASPGVITKETEKKFDHHPFDGTLFVEGLRCQTCDTKKVWLLQHEMLCMSLCPMYTIFIAMPCGMYFLYANGWCRLRRSLVPSTVPCVMCVCPASTITASGSISASESAIIDISYCSYWYMPSPSDTTPTCPVESWSVRWGSGC